MNSSSLEITRIKQVRFSELYLGHPGLGDCLSDGLSAEIKPLPQCEQLRQDVEQLKIVCREAKHYSAPAVEFKVVYDDVTYRAFLMQTVRGPVMVLRRIADAIGLLADLGIPAACIGHMLAKDLSGLFLVSGPMKSGKTTTACTMIKERLNLYGGIAVTAEDPTELPLEGKHGDGLCYQTLAASANGGFADAVKQIVRWGPNIIFVGEIRDRETAVEVLQASVNGRLVISTVQGDSLVKSVMKLHALANEKMVSGGAQLLADGLIAVLHQRLVSAGKPRLETEFLHLKETPSARENILQGKYDRLAADVQLQMAALITAGTVPARKG